MREFFKGWRRKLGVVALGSALAFMGMWLRQLNSDTLDFVLGRINNQQVALLVSCDDGIAFETQTELTIGTPLYQHRFEWFYADLGASSQLYSKHMVRWDLNRFGFRAGMDRAAASTIENRIWIVPHWSIVLPLTLLAAWLLLRKPRATRKPEPSLPPDPDHA